MKFIKGYFNVKFIKEIALSVLLLFSGGFISSGVVTALASGKDFMVTQDAENSSDVDKAEDWKPEGFNQCRSKHGIRILSSRGNCPGSCCGF